MQEIQYTVEVEEDPFHHVCHRIVDVWGRTNPKGES